MGSKSMPETPLIGIVDDDEAVGESIGRLVRSAGFGSAVFSSAALLSSDRLNHTECLILDVQMPWIGGFDLQERLADLDRRIPIIFVTAYPDDDAEKKALDGGAVAFLYKPFGDRALLDAMQLALGR
jgi:FixJ family two-component response regulator